jgi:hypothetical protein
MSGDDELFDEPAGLRVCATCGHMETDHEDRDVEGDTAIRTFCLACESWHPFVPAGD